jgi:hypothetical protein
MWEPVKECYYVTSKLDGMGYARHILVCLVANILWHVRAQCPSGCVCSYAEVNCTHAALTEFPSYKFGKDVQKVNFSCNNITSLGAYTIRKWMLISLRHLNISNNALRTLSEQSFIAQRELDVIDLSGNELEHIPEKTFMYIPKLTWLSLANNKKLKIPDAVPFLTALPALSCSSFSLFFVGWFVYGRQQAPGVGAYKLPPGLFRKVRIWVTGSSG